MQHFKRAMLHSEGYDVFVEGDIPAGKTVKLKTNINLFGILKENQFGLLVARSSLFRKHNLIIPNSPHIIDTDFNDCFSVELYNPTEKDIHVKDRVAQIVIREYHTCSGEVKPTEGGEGRFSSTDNEMSKVGIAEESWKEFQKIIKQNQDLIYDFIRKVQINDDTREIKLYLFDYNTVIIFNGPDNSFKISTKNKKMKMSSKHALTMLFRIIEKFVNHNAIILDNEFTNIKITKESKYKQLFDYTKEDFYLLLNKDGNII